MRFLRSQIANLRRLQVLCWGLYEAKCLGVSPGPGPRAWEKYKFKGFAFFSYVCRRAALISPFARILNISTGEEVDWSIFKLQRSDFNCHSKSDSSLKGIWLFALPTGHSPPHRPCLPHSSWEVTQARQICINLHLGKTQIEFVIFSSHASSICLPLFVVCATLLFGEWLLSDGWMTSWPHDHWPTLWSQLWCHGQFRTFLNKLLQRFGHDRDDKRQKTQVTRWRRDCNGVAASNCYLCKPVFDQIHFKFFQHLFGSFTFSLFSNLN